MVTINTFHTRDRDAVRTLYKNGFAPLIPADLLEKRINMRIPEITENNTIVARVGSRIVGFGTYAKVNDLSCEYDRLQSLNHQLGWARRPDAQDKLEEYLHKIAHINPGPVVVNYHDNTFTQNNFLITEEDYILDGNVVHPLYQNKGIGKKIIQERVARIRNKKSGHALYTTTVEGPSTRALKASGFTSILTSGPAYSDGRSGTFFGLLL